MKIAVLSETATSLPVPSSSGTARWTFLIKISATLTKQNGQVVWTQTEADYSLSRAYPQEEPADIWREPTLQHRLAYDLSDSLVEEMVYGK